jgi:hypothetical protein
MLSAPSLQTLNIDVDTAGQDALLRQILYRLSRQLLPFRVCLLQYVGINRYRSQKLPLIGPKPSNTNDYFP